MKKRLAIIGAGDFQNPLILKAKERGIETHVFAWEDEAIGEKTADFFHPISIIDIDSILRVCAELHIDGVASIGSDLANITVAKVASELGLVSNSIDCVSASTDKWLMRQTLQRAGDPIPGFWLVSSAKEAEKLDLSFPVIVKPTDRSGSRGITKLLSEDGLEAAIEGALAESFSRKALIEEFAEGSEFSVEYISFEGRHTFLSITEKFTTGDPHYIETGHLQPARLSAQDISRVKSVVEHALGSLGVEYGASHSEIKIDSRGQIKIIEIGSRMGGDCIGSDLVELSTGFDFVNAVIDIALGQPVHLESPDSRSNAAIRFVFSQEDIDALDQMKAANPEMVRCVSEMGDLSAEVSDSSNRLGFFIFADNDLAKVERYLPPKTE